MVDAAKAAGAEMVKHQTHIVADEMAGAAKQVIPGNADVSIYTIMERCALNEADELKMKQHTEALGMIWISTPFSRAAFHRLQKFDVPVCACETLLLICVLRCRDCSLPSESIYQFRC